MLVISRRENEKFLFPNLGITIQLIKVAGKVAKIGVDAPRDIRVLREELVTNQQLQLPASITELAGSLPEKMKHEFRNRLNPISLGLQIAQKQIEKGKLENLDKVIEKLIENLKSLDSDLNDNSNDEKLAGERLADVLANAEVDDASLALIVDDSENERSLLSTLLELSGYAVVMVEDGQAAIDYLNQSFRQPDFVLLDMHMPRKNGAETIAEIRRDPKLKGLKVFAVSGSDHTEMNVSVGPDGVDRWFTKPLDARQLVREMARENQSV